jgi:hypothetical protein
MTKNAAASPPRPPRTDVAALPFRWRKGGRSREGELFRRVGRDLRKHLGRPPSVAEGMLIDRIAWLQVHLARIDERALEAGGLSDHARREYLAWTGALCRLLRDLGLQPAAERPLSPEAALAAARAMLAPQPPPRGRSGR